MKYLDAKIPYWGDLDTDAGEQIRRIQEKAVHTALMGDHHLGYSMPIGGVAAYRDFVSPSGVGFDIACGNKAVRLDLKASEVRPDMERIMDEVVERVNFGMGGTNNDAASDHAVFDSLAWRDLKFLQGRPSSRYADFKTMARAQLGTVGAGNHYVDIFADEEDRVWIGVHFGSRGLGHKIATHFLKEGGGEDGIHAEACLISTKSQLGQDYIQAMHLAGNYAYAGRDWVCQTVADILGGHVKDSVHNHHNFAWKEKHHGEELWVVRKGATPAWPGQRGFVGATMTEPSVILQGSLEGDAREQMESLYSTVHGAGRVLGRMQAKGVFKKGVMKRAPMVDQTEVSAMIHEAGVVVRGSGLDEAPQCYKRLDSVLAAHGETVDVLHTLTPMGVAMAGPDVRDPYKD